MRGVVRRRPVMPAMRQRFASFGSLGDARIETIPSTTPFESDEHYPIEGLREREVQPPSGLDTLQDVV